MGRGGGFRFRNFAQRFVCRSSEVPFVKLRNALERVDLLDRFVVADADDAWKTQRVPARMPARMLYRVKRNLEHHLGSHHPSPTSIVDGHAQESLGHICD